VQSSVQGRHTYAIKQIVGFKNGGDDPKKISFSEITSVALTFITK
jgi:hypothetical protein